MKIKFAILKVAVLCLLLSAKSGFCSNWVQIYSDRQSDDEYFFIDIDLDSVYLMDGVRTAWVRYSSSPAQQSIQSQFKAFKSSVQLKVTECKTLSTATQSAVLYALPFGIGESVSSQSVSRVKAIQAMVPNPPDSVGELVAQSICRATLKKKP